MLLVSWEVMGLCSYLLIAHAAQRKSACSAATKAFLVNAVADVGFSFGIILTFYTFGTLDIQTILAQAESMQDRTINILGWMGLDLPIYPVDAHSVLFIHWRYGQIRTNALPRVVALCHGSPDSGLGVDSCRDHGECWPFLVSND